MMRLVLTRVLAVLAFFSFITGCSTNLDGSYTFGARSSPGWAANAPKQDVEAYYDAFSVDELCAKWKAVSWEGRRVESILDQIGSSLQRRGREPDFCDKLCRKNDGQCRPNLW